MTAPRPVRIDIVSDIVCPWCAIGLAALDEALARTADVVQADLTFHPLELNPGTPPAGELLSENMARKYGASPDQARAAGGRIREAAIAAGVDMSGRSDRLYDTFDAHRLLHWAGTLGAQVPLKRELLAAYFTRGENVSDHEVLVGAAERAGLDAATARSILAEGRYADEVHEDEAHWREEGILSVPTFILDGRYVIPGAQPAERFEQALRRRAAAPLDA